MSGIFREGMPYGLVAPMYDDGYGIRPELVDPEFATALFKELKAENRYCVEGAESRGTPGVYHDPSILNHLGSLPCLAEYLSTLNETITEVSGYRRDHLTWLTVRACPIGEMSSQIHRNDNSAGPWLVALTVAGSGSFSIFSNKVIEQGKEKALTGTWRDPKPLASSAMRAGDAWGIYSKEWSAPHAGGLNTSRDPKVLVLLYGWCVRDEYPFRNQQTDRKGSLEPELSYASDGQPKSKLDSMVQAIGTQASNYWEHFKQKAGKS